ncbi:hypothetical protein FH972_018539 [Carpinus fangiana]|uniref:EF-hand domain-containing protein n=1 Tax=Carpinus fangiana TaxID=176857 RepID=A0A5N6RMF8_9ROSI|nr:hypothetical protein FH972_018539 [Carpinus fangiana]
MVRMGVMFVTNSGKGAEVPFNKEQLTKMFKKHDKDNNGKLSWDEVKAAFVELKAFWPWFSTEQGFRYGDNNDDEHINIHDEELERLVDYALKCGFTTT